MIEEKIHTPEKSFEFIRKNFLVTFAPLFFCKLYLNKNSGLRLYRLVLQELKEKGKKPAKVNYLKAEFLNEEMPSEIYAKRHLLTQLIRRSDFDGSASSLEKFFLSIADDIKSKNIDQSLVDLVKTNMLLEILSNAAEDASSVSELKEKYKQLVSEIIIEDYDLLHLLYVVKIKICEFLGSSSYMIMRDQLKGVEEIREELLSLDKYARLMVTGKTKDREIPIKLTEFHGNIKSISDIVRYIKQVDLEEYISILEMFVNTSYIKFPQQ